MSKDRKTRFRINAFSLRKRTYKNGPKKVYRDIKRKCYAQFLEAKRNGKFFSFTTDKLEAYRIGFKKFFRNVAKLTFGVSIKQRKHGLKRNNNCIERDHEYSRALEKKARGHKSVKGISALFDVGDAYYNFIDKQRLSREKLWRTPAARANIMLKLGDTFQLLKLIKKSYAEN